MAHGPLQMEVSCWGFVTVPSPAPPSQQIINRSKIQKLMKPSLRENCAGGWGEWLYYKVWTPPPPPSLTLGSPTLWLCEPYVAAPVCAAAPCSRAFEIENKLWFQAAVIYFISIYDSKIYLWSFFATSLIRKTAWINLAGAHIFPHQNSFSGPRPFWKATWPAQSHWVSDEMAFGPINLCPCWPLIMPRWTASGQSFSEPTGAPFCIH